MYPSRQRMLKSTFLIKQRGSFYWSIFSRGNGTRGRSKFMFCQPNGKCSICEWTDGWNDFLRKPILWFSVEKENVPTMAPSACALQRIEELQAHHDSLVSGGRGRKMIRIPQKWKPVPFIDRWRIARNCAKKRLSINNCVMMRQTSGEGYENSWIPLELVSLPMRQRMDSKMYDGLRNGVPVMTFEQTFQCTKNTPINCSVLFI